MAFQGLCLSKGRYWRLGQVEMAIPIRGAVKTQLLNSSHGAVGLQLLAGVSGAE